MNKLIVITGGTKGIGKAIIEKFSSGGFDIVTASRSEADLEFLKKDIEKNHPTVKLHYQKADLSDQEQVKGFAKFILALNRNIDVLINNSGLYVPGQIHTEADGQLEQMISTNLYSAYHLSRAIIPQMQSQKKGHIFNICSTASTMAYVNGGSYCISKFALYGMTKVLREEMKPYNIKVTAVLPGATKTSSWDGVNLPDERFIKGSDVADTIFAAYSLSDSAVIEELVMRPQLGDII